MKKMILSLLLIGSSCAVFAQIKTGDTTVRNNANLNRTDSMNRMNSDSMNRMNMNMNTDTTRNNAMRNNDTLSTNRAYSAYGTTTVNVPSNIQMSLQKDYPTATNVTWQQNGEWYQGTYNTNGHYTHVFYNQRGATYSLSLPVTQTYVPDDIISKVSNMFGPTVYDVTTLKADSSRNIYQIRTIENGQVKAQWIGEDGSTVMDPFRSTVDTTVNTGAYSAMDSTRMNQNNLNRTDTSNLNNNLNNPVNNNIDSTRNLNVTDSTMMNNNIDSSRMNMNNTDSTQMNTNQSNVTDTTATVTDSTGKMGQGQMKTKTKTKSDGKKTVIKTKKGEMKPKEEKY